MGFRFTQGWKMASLVAIVGALLVVLNGRRVVDEPGGVLAWLSLVAGGFIFVLGASLLIQRHESTD